MRSASITARATGAATKQAAPAARPTKALNLTKSNLVGSQGGQATRNVDGIVYTITYDAATDSISVTDRMNKISYEAVVGTADNRIAALLDSGRPLPGPPSFEQLQSVLKADGPGPEALNGRLAMLSFLIVSGVELATGQTLLQQAGAPLGAAAAAGLGLLTLAASVAPAFAAAVPVNKLFPSTNDSFADRQLPYYFSPLAECINGRAAMLGLAAMAINEAVRGAALF